MRAATRVFPTAFAFRAFLQRELPEHLLTPPRARPFAGRRPPGAAPLPRDVSRRWRRASSGLLAGDAVALGALPIDHAVRPAPLRGGSEAARAALSTFVEDRLARYAEDRNHPDLDAASGLSPYLHFGHVSAHEVFAAIADREEWEPARLQGGAAGRREGFWGMSAGAEAFLDQLAVWRELGFNMCSKRDDAGEYESLPAWARATLEKHEVDARDVIYPPEALEQARTADPLWNAAQRQLVVEGRIHNALRMLWGKKVIGWSRTPREALATLLHLNDKYALDGRDPNSLTGIFWCFGRYDRPWGPERPIFGTVRYMTSESSARKWRLRRYLERWSGTASLFPAEIS
jgi:deoxyribodipyrimidine photo-lyase